MIAATTVEAMMMLVNLAEMVGLRVERKSPKASCFRALAKSD